MNDQDQQFQMNDGFKSQRDFVLSDGVSDVFGALQEWLHQRDLHGKRLLAISPSPGTNEMRADTMNKDDISVAARTGLATFEFENEKNEELSNSVVGQ
jgi:hypothetical protein